MRRRSVWQNILMAGAWALALAALPLKGAELNGFLNWRGEVYTGFLVQWLMKLPRGMVRDWSDPTIHHGFTADGRVAADTMTFGMMDVVWVGAVLVGLLLFALAPLLVRRRFASTKWGQTAIRCLAPALLIFPATALAPEIWRFPLPRIGMYLLGAAHVMMFAALVMMPAQDAGEGAFPVLLRRR